MARPAPRYSLSKNAGFWQLTFEGQQAILKHQQGIYYVAYLLSHPLKEPIHALALALRTAEGMEPSEQSRFSVQVKEARTAWSIRRNQLELEALIDDETELEPVKAEALRELETIYDYQKMNLARTTNTAQRMVRTVRMALNRFHRQLCCPIDTEGGPHLLLGAFAAHLENYLLAPSARCLCGCFTYEPPPGVVWVD